MCIRDSPRPHRPTQTIHQEILHHRPHRRRMDRPHPARRPPHRLRRHHHLDQTRPPPSPRPPYEPRRPLRRRPVRRHTLEKHAAPPSPATPARKTTPHPGHHPHPGPHHHTPLGHTPDQERTTSPATRHSHRHRDHHRVTTLQDPRRTTHTKMKTPHRADKIRNMKENPGGRLAHGHRGKATHQYHLVLRSTHDYSPTSR